MREVGMSATVAELLYYPVKGCASQSIDTATMTTRGLEHDREYMIVDADGAFLSQRSDPELAVVRPSVVGNVLTLVHARFGSVAVAVERESAAREVTMFGRPCRGIDQGDEVAAWLSEVTGEPARLVSAVENAPSFADSGAVHVVSVASLDELNSRLDRPLPMNRFRPNIVLTGHSDPHAEDRVRRARVGTAELVYTKLAVRCAVTTVDQSRGERDGTEPLRTLATYRRGPDKGVVFGVKLSVSACGTLSVGDEFTVVEDCP